MFLRCWGWNPGPGASEVSTAAGNRSLCTPKSFPNTDRLIPGPRPLQATSPGTLRGWGRENRVLGSEDLEKPVPTPPPARSRVFKADAHASPENVALVTNPRRGPCAPRPDAASRSHLQGNPGPFPLTPHKTRAAPASGTEDGPGEGPLATVLTNTQLELRAPWLGIAASAGQRTPQPTEIRRRARCERRAVRTKLGPRREPTLRGYHGLGPKL